MRSSESRYSEEMYRLYFEYNKGIRLRTFNTPNDEYGERQEW